MSRRVMTNFTADDMGAAPVSAPDEPDESGKSDESGKPAESTKSTEPKTRRSAKQAKTEDVDETKVPEGSVDELTEWVGDDKDRAEKALEAENAKDHPRVTAIEAFESVLTEPEADEK